MRSDPQSVAAGADDDVLAFQFGGDGVWVGAVAVLDADDLRAFTGQA